MRTRDAAALRRVLTARLRVEHANTPAELESAEYDLALARRMAGMRPLTDVIATLTAERDEARAALTQSRADAGISRVGARCREEHGAA